MLKSLSSSSCTLLRESAIGSVEKFKVQSSEKKLAVSSAAPVRSQRVIQVIGEVLFPFHSPLSQRSDLTSRSAAISLLTSLSPLGYVSFS